MSAEDGSGIPVEHFKTADGIWSIYFYDVLLARLDERDFKLYASNSVTDVPGCYSHLRSDRVLIRALNAALERTRGIHP